MDIFTKHKNRTAKFLKVAEGATEEDKRVAEERLLKPETLLDYDGALPEHRNELDARTVLIVFRNKAQMELVGELFSIRHSCAGKSYITNIQLLENLARGVRKGEYAVIKEHIIMVGGVDVEINIEGTQTGRFSSDKPNFTEIDRKKVPDPDQAGSEQTEKPKKKKKGKKSGLDFFKKHKDKKKKKKGKKKKQAETKPLVRRL